MIKTNTSSSTIVSNLSQNSIDLNQSFRSKIDFYRVPYLLKIIAIICLGSIGHGYELGILNGSFFYKPININTPYISERALIMISMVFQAIGAVFGGVIGDKLGRKFGIIIANLMILSGGFFIMIAENLGSLLFGKIMNSLAFGSLVPTSLIYVSEISPTKIRGSMLTAVLAALALGNFLAYTIAFAATAYWKFLLCLSVIPVFIQLFFLFSLPETPPYLLKKGLDKAAAIVYRRIFLTHFEIAQMEMDKEFNQILIKRRSDRYGIFERFSEIFKLSFLGPFLGFSLLVFQTLCGESTIVYYAPEILRKTGYFPQNQHHYISYAALPFLAINFIGMYFNFRRIDRWGRKATMTNTLPGVAVALFLMGLGSGIDYLGGINYGSWLTCIALLCFLFFYSLGLTCTPLVFNSEIYFLHLRCSSMGLIYGFGLIMNYVFSNVFLALTRTPFGEMVTFLAMSLFAVLGHYFFTNNLPETRLRTLSEISDIIRGKKKLLLKKERIHSPQNIDCNLPSTAPQAPGENFDKMV